MLRKAPTAGRQSGLSLIDMIIMTITKLTHLLKTFNMAGMKVGKNAKGIVILQGGKKYFNK